VDLIARLGMERAGNRLNGFVAPTAAKFADVPA
jgi:PTH1 family peptidyl-tRNA hydrolase